MIRLRKQSISSECPVTEFTPGNFNPKRIRPSGVTTTVWVVLLLCVVVGLTVMSPEVAARLNGGFPLMR